MIPEPPFERLPDGVVETATGRFTKQQLAQFPHLGDETLPFARAFVLHCAEPGPSLQLTTLLSVFRDSRWSDWQVEQAMGVPANERSLWLLRLMTIKLESILVEANG